MKKNLFFIVLILTFSSSSAQSFTLPELLSLCNKENWDDVNEYMIRKGWEYEKSSKGDDDHYSTITWSYEKNSDNDMALAWFYLFTHDNTPGKLEFSFSDASTYSVIKAGLATQGAKFINSSVEEDEIKARYANATHLITLTTEKAEAGNEGFERTITSYSVTILKKQSIYDEENGLKKFYDDAGNLEVEATLKDGRLHGISKAYYPGGGIKVVSTFINGEKQGVVKEYDEEGLVDKEYEVVNGVLNGSFTEYYYHDSKLMLKETGRFVNDVKVGQWQLIKLKDDKNSVLQYHNYVNGTKNGPFKEVKGDSIIFGSYKNDMLHGDYNVYIDFGRMLFGGEINGDATKNAVLFTKGRYFDGEKDGYWKEFSITNTLISEGWYKDDEKTGEWKYYYDNYTGDKPDESQPYSKQLFLIENYNNGVLNGKSTRFSYLDKIAKSCDTSENKNANPLDTCYKMVFEKLTETAYYKSGILHGPIEIYDSIGLLRTKGTFVNGKKEGLWVEGYSNDGFINYVRMYLYQKGTYSAGKRVGNWEEYTKEGKIDKNMFYKDGLLDGKVLSYNSAGKPIVIYGLGSDYLKEVEVFDSLGINLERSYTVLSETTETFAFRKTELRAAGKIVTDYLIHKSNPAPFPHTNFELNLIFLTGNLSDGETGYKQGEYKEFNKKGQVLIEGVYHRNLKEGVWNYYKDNGKLIKSERYESGVLKKS